MGKKKKEAKKKKMQEKKKIEIEPLTYTDTGINYICIRCGSYLNKTNHPDIIGCMYCDSFYILEN